MAYGIWPKSDKHEYSSTQVDLPEPARSKVLAMSKKVKDEHLADDGREKDPHITVKYGLHAKSPSSKLKSMLGHVGPVQAKLGKTSLFEGDDHDVLKLDVASHDLHRVNKKIAAAEPHTDTHPDYHPHVTLAYIKKGTGKHYVGDSSLHGHPLTFDHIKFSGKDGKEHAMPLGKYSLA